MNRFYERFAALGKGIDTVVRTYNDTAATGRTLHATRRKFAELGSGDPSVITPPEDVTTEIKLTNKSATELRSLAVDGSA